MMGVGLWLLVILLLVLAGVVVASRPPSGRWLAAGLLVLAAVLLVGLLAVGVGMPGGRGPMMDGPMSGTMGEGMSRMMGRGATDGSAPSAFSEAPSVTVEAGDLWFDPTSIEVVAGEPTNLALVNRGETFHDLTIDELDLGIGADPGRTTTAGVQIDEPGEYEFTCSVPGHASAGMQGTLTVVPAPS